MCRKRVAKRRALYPRHGSASRTTSWPRSKLLKARESARHRLPSDASRNSSASRSSNEVARVEIVELAQCLGHKLLGKSQSNIAPTTCRRRAQAQTCWAVAARQNQFGRAFPGAAVVAELRRGGRSGSPARKLDVEEYRARI